MATKLIGLDAGHGLNTAGKQTPTGIKEWTLNDKICDYVADYLKEYDVDILRTDNNEGVKDEALAQRVKTYLDAGVVAFASCHHNAFTADWNNATGVEVYVDNKATEDDLEFAEIVYNKLVKYTGLRGRGIKRADFTVINQNKVPAILIEGGFMDGTNDYKIITSEKGQKAYAQAVAEGFIEFCKLEKKVKEMYRVAKEYKNGKFVGQIGAFGVKDNAINMCKKNKGTHVFDSKGKIIFSNVEEVKPAPTPTPAPVKPVTPTPKPQPKPETKPTVTYQVFTNKWLGEITEYNETNSNGYAGILGTNISGVRAKLSNGKTIRIRSHIKGRARNVWLSEVTKWDNTGNGYSGIKNLPIDCISIGADGVKLRYRVHVKGGKWLPWVTGYNINDYNNGVAGTYGKTIDAIQIDVL